MGEYMEQKAQDQIEGGISINDELHLENNKLKERIEDLEKKYKELFKFVDDLDPYELEGYDIKVMQKRIGEWDNN